MWSEASPPKDSDSSKHGKLQLSLTMDVTKHFVTDHTGLTLKAFNKFLVKFIFINSSTQFLPWWSV